MSKSQGGYRGYRGSTGQKQNKASTAEVPPTQIFFDRDVLISAFEIKEFQPSWAFSGQHGHPPKLAPAN
jgi:hypothetical protein